MISTLLSGLMAAAATVAALLPFQAQPPTPPAVFGQVIDPGSFTTTIVRTEMKCHMRAVQIDPQFDAKARIPIPEQTIATSKIRRIPLPCGDTTHVTVISSFGVVTVEGLREGVRKR
jgi:hypothetical protein